VLTAGQIAHFETFGFVVLRQLFTPEEMATIKRESDEIFDEVRGGAPFAGEERQAVQPFFERRPFLAGLAADDRIYGIGEDLLGPDFVLDGTEGNLHVGETAWHGSAPRKGYVLETKITFYPEPVTRETGCLRVVPGSHRPMSPDPYAPLRDLKRDSDFRPFGMRPSEIPSYAIESQPGDVLVFTENLLHASFGGHAGRHQHAISFFRNPQTEEELAYVRHMYDIANYSFRPSTSYINNESPRIRRMVSRLVEWGFKPIDA